MFRRRVPLSWKGRLREIILPRKGFSRLYSYMAQRVLRMPGTPYSLAAGFACGVAVSFTPLIGFHLVLAAVLAYLMRANIIASWAGTIIGNPWTFPFIFILLFKVGSYLTEMFGLQNWFFAGEAVTGFGQFTHHFFPMVIGGMVMGVISWGVSFGLAYWAVVSWRRHRARRMAVKRQIRARSSKV